jgi:metal-responsive CopG/Arc/MetJ family transcriptional regulator
MRITVDIDVNEIKKIQKITGEKKKSPAVAKALSAYIREQQKRQLIERALSGQTDYAMTNEKLELLDVYEAR